MNSCLRIRDMVQWLGLCPSNAGGVGSIPGQGTKIPHVLWCSQKMKKKKKKNQSPDAYIHPKLLVWSKADSLGWEKSSGGCDGDGRVHRQGRGPGPSTKG